MKTSEELTNERQLKIEDETTEMIQTTTKIDDDNSDSSDEEEDLLDTKSEKFVNDKYYYFLGKDYVNLYEKNVQFDAGLHFYFLLFIRANIFFSF